MADRVYPNNENTDMGSKVQFNSINWVDVEKNIKNSRFAQEDNKEQLMNLVASLVHKSPEEVEGLVEEAAQLGGSDEMSDVNEEEQDSQMESDDMHAPTSDIDNEDSGDSPSTPTINTGFGESEDDGSEHGSDDRDFDGQGDAEEPDFEKSWKNSSKNNKMKKIAFTNSNQISAEAIEKAMAAGDEKLVNTILAARKANRLRIAKAIESNLKKEAKPQVKESSVALEFTSPSKFTQAQRQAFNKIAIDLGMPKEYVSAMCKPMLSGPVVALNSKIKEVYASNISEASKATFVEHLVKEAKLSSDSKSEFINFWNNILGYQDKDFWPMVAADYVDGKKAK